MKDILIDKRFRVDRNVGSGGCGVVYAGTDLESNSEVAIKLEPLNQTYKLLDNEKQMYEKLVGGKGIPELLWTGKEGEYSVLITELLGPSLSDLFSFCDKKFSLKTVLYLADQILSRLEFIHSKGVIHRDLTPNNLILGQGENGNMVYVVDFGLMSEYREREYVDNSRDYALVPSCLYESIRGHRCQKQSQRDDLESLGYILAHFLIGSLPWQNSPDRYWRQKDVLWVANKKENCAKDLCKGLPQEFAAFLKYVRGLEYAEQPNYVYVRQLFQTVFDREGFEDDGIFDWTVKIHEQIQTTAVRSSPNNPSEPKPNWVMLREEQDEESLKVFWDRLSNVTLTYAALRELNRRTFYTLPDQVPSFSELDASRDIKTFARNGGGPDLSSLRNFRRIYRPKSPREATTVAFTSRVQFFNRNLEQHFIDNGIYPSGHVYSDGTVYEERYDNIHVRREVIGAGDKIRSDFAYYNRYERQPDQTVSELVVPTLDGNSTEFVRYVKKVQFDNLEPLTDDNTKPEEFRSAEPDMYYGEPLESINETVLDQLNDQIVPSKERRPSQNYPVAPPAVPNFFVIVQAPDMTPEAAELEACYCGALGARAMHSLQSYISDRPVYNGFTRAMSCIYHDGTLKMYYTIMTPPFIPGGNPRYHMVHLKTYNMTESLLDYHEGVAAYRSARNMAGTERRSFILMANKLSEVRAGSHRGSKRSLPAVEGSAAAAPIYVQGLEEIEIGGYCETHDTGKHSIDCPDSKEHDRAKRQKRTNSGE